MAEKEAGPVSLDTMLARGEELIVGERRYWVLPLKLKEIKEFETDGLWINDVIQNLLDEGLREKLDKWLQRAVRTGSASGTAVTLAQVMEEDWDLDHLRTCLRKLARLSG